jgi:hypothetical protein
MSGLRRSSSTSLAPSAVMLLYTALNLGLSAKNIRHISNATQQNTRGWFRA